MLRPLLEVATFNICKCISIFADIILSMPAIPDTITYERLQHEYKANLNKRIDKERERAMANTNVCYYYYLFIM
jgi:hypothetical protein